MKYFCLAVLLSLFGCFGSKDELTTMSAGTSSCKPFIFTEDIVATTYIGSTETTSGNCGEEYTVVAPVGYLEAYDIPEVNTGWRFENAYLQTTAGNINFASGGRWMLSAPSRNAPDNEGTGFNFTEVDHTTCQNAHGINGAADLFLLEVTAEFDENCQARLRGTFREYSRCVDSSEVEICSGTVTLSR